ncbi:leucine-rich repeat domain-containing protein [Rhizophagus irregularis DAOM 181602=DAOM 197198]|nr:leucine-rich repeat domain-containing protein [Rhizophagus irregularis DAOM 181602=DAOM 197198]
MVNAQEWLDNNYPINGTCINEDDKENYGKRREEIVELDISNKNLEGPLAKDGGWINLPSFPKLKKLNLSNNYIRKADLAHAPELTHLDVSNNQLAELNIPSKNLQELNCSDNPPLTNLSLASDSSPQVTVLVVAFLDLL